jgi:hypothetical protein
MPFFPFVIASAARQSRMLGGELGCRVAPLLAITELAMRDALEQTQPLGVHSLYQSQLLNPRTALDPLLLSDRGVHRPAHHIPDEHLAPSFLGKPIRHTLAVLPGPLRQVGRHASVECPIAFARHDVDGRVFHRLTLPSSRPPPSLRAQRGNPEPSRSPVQSLRGAQRRSNPDCPNSALDCRASLAMTDTKCVATLTWLRQVGFISSILARAHTSIRIGLAHLLRFPWDRHRLSLLQPSLCGQDGLGLSANRRLAETI